MDHEQLCESIIQAVSQRLGMNELPLDIPVETSARHVHLTDQAIEALFGPGAKLMPKRPLSQPGQFLSEQRVRIVTPKGEIANVAVLGPARSAVQVELSATDARTLGIQAPVRLSGDLRDAADVWLVGSHGMIAASGSAIIARAHIHILPQDAARIGVSDGQKVSVALHGMRPLTLDQVIVRVSEKAGLAVHIDRDEANACMLDEHTTARIRPKGIQPLHTAEPSADTPPANDPAQAICESGEHLITETKARALAAVGQTVRLGAGTLVTPAAQDVFRSAGITIIRT